MVSLKHESLKHYFNTINSKQPLLLELKEISSINLSSLHRLPEQRSRNHCVVNCFNKSSFPPKQNKDPFLLIVFLRTAAQVAEYS